MSTAPLPAPAPLRRQWFRGLVVLAKTFATLALFFLCMYIAARYYQMACIGVAELRIQIGVAAVHALADVAFLEILLAFWGRASVRVFFAAGFAWFALFALVLDLSDPSTQVVAAGSTLLALYCLVRFILLRRRPRPAKD
jgi:hypothetical protein